MLLLLDVSVLLQKRGGETTQLLGGTTQLLASAQQQQQQQQYGVQQHHQPLQRPLYEECTTKLLADTTGASSSAPRMMDLQPPAQHAAAHGANLSRLSGPHAAWPGSAYHEPPASPELMPLETVGKPAAARGAASVGRAQPHAGGVTAAAAGGRGQGHGVLVGSSQDKDEPTLELNMTGGAGMTGGHTMGLEDVTLDEFALPPDPQAIHRGVEQRQATMAFSG